MKFLLFSIRKFIENYPIALFLSVLSLICAVLIMQYGFGLSPCKLCKIQRLPYYFILIIACVNFALKRRFELYYVCLGILALFVTAAFGFYHAGIEYGVFENIFNCSAGQDKFADGTALKEYLTNKISVPCDRPAFKLIFTLSGWNFIIATIIGLLGIKRVLSKKIRD